MITDTDIIKLKAVFATKEDFLGMEQRFDKKFATKVDVSSIINEISSIKNEMISMEKRLKKEIVKEITDFIQNNIINILNEHERRLDRLEKHVGGFPTLA